MSAGHSGARFYPLGVLHDESNIVVERQQAQMVTEATLLQMAVSSVLSKKAGKNFEKRIAQLNVKTVPFDSSGGEDGEGDS